MLESVACKEKRNKLYYFTYFYIMLNDFINCPAFVHIKLWTIKYQQSKYNQRDVYFFMHCFLCLFRISSLDKVFQWLFETGFFLFGRQKKVITGSIRQVVVLHSNNCMGLCLDVLSFGRLGRVVILQRWLFEQV